MGLLDDLTSIVGGNARTSQGVAGSLIELLGGGQGGGGLGSLVQSFQQAGLGHLMDSWIGTGQNLPVSGAQVQQALGPQVQAMAAQHGMSVESVSGFISQLLPQLVDHLTPEGRLPQGREALAQSLSSLQSQLGI
jgi:uncharacterized protein YidB (DUF937 family)